jgi:hypothetical protein
MLINARKGNTRGLGIGSEQLHGRILLSGEGALLRSITSPLDLLDHKAIFYSSAQYHSRGCSFLSAVSCLPFNSHLSFDSRISFNSGYSTVPPRYFQRISCVGPSHLPPTLGRDFPMGIGRIRGSRSWVFIGRNPLAISQAILKVPELIDCQARTEPSAFQPFSFKS